VWWKAVWKFLKKWKIDFPCNPIISLLGTYQKECKSGNNRETCTPMFTAVLFTIAKLWKQPRCSTTDEWIKSICIFLLEYIHCTGEIHCDNSKYTYIVYWLDHPHCLAPLTHSAVRILYFGPFSPFLYSYLPLELSPPFFNSFQYISLYSLPSQTLCFRILLMLYHSLFLSFLP
jgi:hypothetical protein